MFVQKKEYDVRLTVIIAICLISFIFSIIDIVLIIKQIRLGTKIWQIHNWTLAPYNSINPINARRSMFEVVLRSLLTGPFSYVIYPIATFYFFDFNKNKKKRILIFAISIANLVLSSLASLGGRIGLVYFFVCFIISFFVSFSRGSIPKKQLKVYLFIFLTVIVSGLTLFVVYTTVRTDFSKLFKQIYTYIALPPTLLTKWLNSIKASQNTYGFLSFFGIHTYFFRALKLIGLDALVPQVYNLSYEWILNAEIFEYVGYGKANAFVTPVFYFLTDGGIPFICIASLSFGFALQLFYTNIVKNQNLKNLTIYMVIFYAVIFSFIRVQTASPGFIIAFLFLFIVLKSNSSLSKTIELKSYDDKISVIVPVYKVEDLLDKCVKSILSQTYKNIEIILVDDGSPDNCGKMCDDFAKMDTRIKVIHKKNGGLSDARNAGIEVATGSYLTFIDSDDYIDPEYVEVLYLSLILNNSDISICSHRVILNDKIIDKSTGKLFTSGPETILKKIMYDKGVDLSAWAKLYKKELFDSIKYPVGRLYEDAATTYLLIDKAIKVSVCSIALYNYVIRNNSISQNSFSEKKLDLIISTKEMTDFVALKYPKTKRACKRRLLYSYFSTLTQYAKSNTKNPSIEKELFCFIRKNSLPVFLNVKTPLRDKAAIVASLFGLNFYRRVWNIFGGK